MISKTIYQFGRAHQTIELEKEPYVFSESLTDQSYYICSSESVKLGETKGSPTVGAYDNSQVTDDLINLRRPGNDITEVSEMVDNIKADTRDKVDNVVKSVYESEKAKAETESQMLKTVVDNAVQSATVKAE